MERNKKKTEWSNDEIELLTKLHPRFPSKKWKRISHEFKLRGFQRSQIECREKWINFADPAINKHDWSPEELRQLYQIHNQFGTRWCLVQRAIGRTQNKIKNRFYGTLRNLVRLLLNHFDGGHSAYNTEITKLSPKFLNDMYCSQNNFTFLKGEIQSSIQAMGYRVQKKMMADRIRQERPLYTKLYHLLTHALELPATTNQDSLSPPPLPSLPPPVKIEQPGPSYVLQPEPPITWSQYMAILIEQQIGQQAANGMFYICY